MTRRGNKFIGVLRVLGKFLRVLHAFSGIFSVLDIKPRVCCKGVDFSISEAGKSGKYEGF